MAKTRTAMRLMLAILFFCLFSSLAFAALPTLGTITPSSGTTTPNIAKTFTCKYSDTDGWANIKEAYLLINVNSTSFTNTCYLYYDQNANLLYLRDDTNTTWLGGYSPASANTIQNSQVILNCASTTVSGLTTTLTITWNITFKQAYSGKSYNTYLKVVDDTGGLLNWVKKGTYTVNTIPAIGIITPSTGTGVINQPVSFMTTYSDADGYQNIQYVYFLMNSSTSGLTCLYAYYNQNTNLLYLRNDLNTAWLGGYTPGSANTIENSYAKLDCSQTTVTGSAATLTINWSVILKPLFTGAKNTYLYVMDDVNAYKTYTKVGTWTIPNSLPQLGTITPSSGTSTPNQAVTFTSTYSDADGWQNIQYVYLITNTYANGTNCLYSYYDTVANKLYLRNDANSAWVGGYIPGSSNTISNTYVALNCAQTTVSGSGPNLTVNWSITFKDAFSSRANNCYLYVTDNAGKAAGWTQKGSWTILSAYPQIKIPIEAELSTITSPFVRASDTNASSSQYVNLPNGSGNNTTSPGGPGVISASFNITQQDNYSIWARVIAPSTSDDSLFARIDSGAVQYWVAPVNSIWLWAQVKDYTKGTFYTRLTAGAHTIYFRQREDGIKIDKIILINDPLYIPGAGDVVSPDSTPPVGTIKINNDAAYINSPAVTLNLSATDSGSGMGAGAQMQFSNDNIAWSSPEAYSAIKVWNTTEGDGKKTVYVKFKDAAGNWSTVYSDLITLCSGEFIYPEQGGIVTSSNGKIKLIIPPNALWEPTPILLTLVSPDSLQGATPQNYQLRAVADCKPLRLIFRKPCQLIITLDNAEVPGTPIELGLLDEETQQIVFMEEASSILTDGITIQFPITHFSTYAGLSSLLSQGAPIGAGVKIPLPDMLTGAFGHSISITVPPGRKNMQPNINLQYRSSNPNSWVGMGWSINPGYIVRSTKLGPPTHADNDTFIFVTDSGSTELTHLIDNLYQAKIESAFAKFYKEANDSWKVIQKDGTLLRFGQSPDSKETSLSGTSLWNLTKVIDNNGNYIELNYTKDQGKAYLDYIDYTGNENTGTLALNRLEFILENRTDVSSSYISGSEVKVAKRLSQIRVTQQNDLVWRYGLVYEYSPDTKRSLLKSVTQYSSDGKVLPTQTFKYQSNM